MLAALALEECGEVRDDAVGHFVAELVDDGPEVIDFHHQNEQTLARVLMLGNVLQVVYQADPVVDAGQRVRCNPVLQEGHIDVQERERKDGVRERDVRDEVLEDARKTGNEGDEREVERFFAVRGVLLGDGVLDADDHRRENVEQVEPDEEGQQSPELERCRVAVVGEPVDAYPDADEDTDDARRRKKREQVLVGIDALADSEKDEGKPELPEEKRGDEAQRVHDRIDDTDFLVAPVKVVLHMDHVQHLRHCAQHNVDDGIDDGKAENAFFEVPKDALLELEQRNEQHCYTNEIDFY